MNVVVDASALAAIAFGEPQSDVVIPRLRGVQCHAIALLPFELANVTAMRCRKDPGATATYLEALHEMLRLPVRLHDVDPAGVVRLALEHRLTAYDAAYLWLARGLGCPLVTLDRELAIAAARVKPDA